MHKKGQLTDDEFFSNESGSTEFENFLNLLGGKICLKGKVTKKNYIGHWINQPILIRDHSWTKNP